MDLLHYVKVTSGDTYEYLKGISLAGRIDEFGEFIVYGCVYWDEPTFYEGLYQMDKAQPIWDFESAEDVKEYWEDGGEGMLLRIASGCFELVDPVEPQEETP